MTKSMTTLFALIVIFISAQAASAVLVAHWTFDDVGNPYVDSAGSNDGTKELAGTPSIEVGQIGNAIRFNGDATLNVGSSSVFDTSSYTVSAWLNRDAGITSWRTAVGSWFGGNFWMHFGIDGTTANRFSNYTQPSPGGLLNVTDTVPNIVDGQWYHVVSVADPANDRFQLWVDGVKTAETPNVGWNTTEQPGTNNVYIATKDGTGNLWDGLIDDVGIWNEALSPSQIDAIYNNGLAGLNLAVPEPSSIVLAILGQLSLGFVGWRRRRR